MMPDSNSSKNSNSPEFPDGSPLTIEREAEIREWAAVAWRQGGALQIASLLSAELFAEIDRLREALRAIRELGDEFGFRADEALDLRP